MPICTSCAAELRPDWKFCIACGAQVAPVAAEPAPDVEPVVEPDIEPEIEVGPAPEPEPEVEPDDVPDPDPDPDPDPTISTGAKIARYAPLAFSAVCFLAAGAVIAWLAVNVWL